MNNLEYWIPNCSPYISRMLYDIDNRTFTIEFVNNVNDFKPLLKFVCKSVLSYSENTVDEDYDDDLIDGVIDIAWNEVDKTLVVLTDKKEMILKLGQAPICENVT
ncbi:hypothetical protein CWC26_13180 [Pseudoalteromonas sp. S4488]|jgi:hypothetical protein|uniref:hypothetical protein n=1 Tax=Pseudoalteromonas TaxID=53246 RepID=UPI001023810D|nr:MULTISPECIES: hypothetical protein [unclassified Pseudoalteromonas]NRA79238.1 hypothetical protein [Pseudoalteromonas sp.]RZF78870.1 hypothetical protein EXT43_16630 [Pseudoalteromonas sp. CO109Y]TMO37600.1 hypothetical protein CWC26_13180 [Pseudoalteromonas sp. S4488]URQ88605.1 hypothetical protein J8Z28_18335 [Pseudoalteromonas sp. SCSIO 43088]